MKPNEKEDLLDAMSTVLASEYVGDEFKNGGYHAALDFLNEVRADLVDRETEPVGPITLYAHEDSDDCENEIEAGLDAGLTTDVAEEFARSSPLYEVAFDFMVDPIKGTAECIEVRGCGGARDIYRNVRDIAPLLIGIFEVSPGDVRMEISKIMTMLGMLPPDQV